LLYGPYTNLIGRSFAQANPGDPPGLADSSASQADAGLNQFLTVCSYDLNLDNDGQPRVNLNQPDADPTAVGLPQGALTYLAALQRSGQQLTNTVDLLWATNTLMDDKSNRVVMSSSITPAELPVLLDRCTTTNDARLVGLVNLNTASAKVLAALPGLNEALAESIVAARAGLSADASKTTAWLIQEGIVTADVFKQIAPYLTTRSRQFHFFAAAYSVPLANCRVLEAVVDVGTQPPVILLLRDVSRLGLPFDPTTAPTAGGTTPTGFNPPPS
jgi:DNA uptake protein ComE-like DNA-binding protein